MKMTPLLGHQFCDVSAFPRLLDLDLSVVVFCSSTSTSVIYVVWWPIEGIQISPVLTVFYQDHLFLEYQTA